MKRPQRNGTFFKVLLSNSRSQSMPVICIFDHDEIYESLQKNLSSMLRFEHLRVSEHHGLKGIVSTDDTKVHRLSNENLIEASKELESTSHAVSSTSTNNDEQSVEKESKKELMH